jgi:hypothetical protein
MINIHVDLDNLWMYEQEFNISINPDREYIYSESLPLFLKLLNKFKSKATFMVIGQDLNLPACQAFCRKAVILGHEIANHSWSHPVSFGTLSYEQKKQQIVKTHKKIIEICGIKPVGFRGPGYYQDKEIITVLNELNYHYDSSVLPGVAQLMMSSYAFLRGGKNKHKSFGRTNYIISQETPYFVRGLALDQKLQELPISVLPLFRLPIHTTFAYYFGSEYRRMILYYLKSKPSYLLYLFHAIDFVDLPHQFKNHPIIPLRYSFQERIKYIQSILDILVHINSGGLQTSRESIKAIPHQYL